MTKSLVDAELEIKKANRFAEVIPIGQEAIRWVVVVVVVVVAVVISGKRSFYLSGLTVSSL